MKEISIELEEKLFSEAEKMMQRSYIPYSGFAVGAALLAKNGTIYTGCNVENAAFTPSNCAERTAFFKAVSEGVKEFDAIAVLGGKDRKISDLCTPCGVCRQVMAEFCKPDDFLILMRDGNGNVEKRLLSELLPSSFGPGNLL